MRVGKDAFLDLKVRIDILFEIGYNTEILIYKEKQ